MPWEKQFDTDQALNAAMQAFWARGYEATSMQDLVDCMGINRGSLYATFGSKHRLFLAALRRYDAVHREAWVSAISAGGSPRQAILDVFNGAIRAALESGRQDGCLLVNSALELAPHDDKVAAIVGHGFAEMERYFADKIAEAQAAGEIPDHVQPVETARGLLGLFIGLRVLGRARPDAAVLQALARQADARLQ